MIRKLPGKHGRIPGKGQPWGAAGTGGQLTLRLAYFLGDTPTALVKALKKLL